MPCQAIAPDCSNMDTLTKWRSSTAISIVDHLTLFYGKFTVGNIEQQIIPRARILSLQYQYTKSTWNTVGVTKSHYKNNCNGHIQLHGAPVPMTTVGSYEYKPGHQEHSYPWLGNSSLAQKSLGTAWYSVMTIWSFLQLLSQQECLDLMTGLTHKAACNGRIQADCCMPSHITSEAEWRNSTKRHYCKYWAFPLLYFYWNTPKALNEGTPNNIGTCSNMSTKFSPVRLSL